jgi:hypothetical protein
MNRTGFFQTTFGGLIGAFSPKLKREGVSLRQRGLRPYAVLTENPRWEGEDVGNGREVWRIRANGCYVWVEGTPGFIWEWHCQSGRDGWAQWPNLDCKGLSRDLYDARAMAVSCAESIPPQRERLTRDG